MAFPREPGRRLLDQASCGRPPRLRGPRPERPASPAPRVPSTALCERASMDWAAYSERVASLITYRQTGLLRGEQPCSHRLPAVLRHSGPLHWGQPRAKSATWTTVPLRREQRSSASPPSTTNYATEIAGGLRWQAARCSFCRLCEVGPALLLRWGGSSPPRGSLATPLRSSSPLQSLSGSRLAREPLRVTWRRARCEGLVNYYLVTLFCRPVSTVQVLPLGALARSFFFSALAGQWRVFGSMNPAAARSAQSRLISPETRQGLMRNAASSRPRADSRAFRDVQGIRDSMVGRDRSRRPTFRGVDPGLGPDCLRGPAKPEPPANPCQAQVT